ncbi:MAG: hypothetical protein FJ109_19475 [Deltaproteobacteria bacterium]|nr:hypothetical protein [Deltaproteobacteria bacterium]
MERDIRLPIKVVVPREDDIRRPESNGGSDKKVFGEVTAEVREALDYQLGSIDAYFRASFSRFPQLPAVAKVTLKPKALAKSHRPTAVFDGNTCPVFGVGRLGELYVRVTPDGLRSLRQRIRTVRSIAGKANLSTIQQMVPYGADDALSLDLARQLESRPGELPTKLKLRLFRHGQGDVDAMVERALQSVLAESGAASAEPVWYGPTLRVYRLRIARPDVVRQLSGFVGTQSLAMFPTYVLRRTASHPIGSLEAADYPSPEPGRDYPTVGIIDTGIDPGSAVLAPWIVQRHQYVPSALIDHDHGSFVGGLVVHSRRLNRDPRFPDWPTSSLFVHRRQLSLCVSRPGVPPTVQLVFKGT